MGARPSLFTPDVDRYLLHDEGEEIIDEVTKHPVCMIVPGLITIAGVTIMASSVLVGSFWYLLVILGLLVSVYGLVRLHIRYMDRFVITNMRVFRVDGVITRHVATMPLSRILDISVTTPLLGMVFNYGHFVFESAAADQGVKHVTYVRDPNRRDLIIQGVIQRAGIRAVAIPGHTIDGT